MRTGMKQTLQQVRQVVVSVCATGAVLVLPGIASAQAPAQPTFAKDVAPIFQEKCEACHRPD